MRLHILQVGRGVLVKADLRVAAVIHGGKGQILALLHTLHLLSKFSFGTAIFKARYARCENAVLSDGAKAWGQILLQFHAGHLLIALATLQTQYPMSLLLG